MSIFIFVCEGAVDLEGNVITSEMVHEFLKREGEKESKGRGSVDKRGSDGRGSVDKRGSEREIERESEYGRGDRKGRGDDNEYEENEDSRTRSRIHIESITHNELNTHSHSHNHSELNTHSHSHSHNELNNYDPRILKIGHIQRGGPTSARDRILGTLAGVEAIDYLMNSNEPEPIVIKFRGMNVFRMKLNEAIRGTRMTHRLMENRKYEEVFLRRDRMFQMVYELYERHRRGKVEELSKVRNRMEDVIGMHFLNLGKEGDGNRESVNREIGRESDVKKRMDQNGMKNDKRMDQNDKRMDQSNCRMDQSNCRMDQNDSSNDQNDNKKKKKKILIAHEGPLAPGINTCLNMLIQEGIIQGYEMYCALGGLEKESSIIKAKLYEYNEYSNTGGSIIGTGTGKISNKILREFNKIILIGDVRNIKWIIQRGNNRESKGNWKERDGNENWKEMESVNKRMDQSDNYSNNYSSTLHDNKNTLHGTLHDSNTLHDNKIILIPIRTNKDNENEWICLGDDTILNGMCTAMDTCKEFCFSKKKTMGILNFGKMNRYLSVLGGLAGEASDILVRKGEIKGNRLMELRNNIIERYRHKRRDDFLVIKRENVGPRDLVDFFTTGTKQTVISQSIGLLEANLTVSAMDKIVANLFAMKAIEFIGGVNCEESDGSRGTGGGSKERESEKLKGINEFERERERGNVGRGSGVICLIDDEIKLVPFDDVRITGKLISGMEERIKLIRDLERQT